MTTPAEQRAAAERGALGILADWYRTFVPEGRVQDYCDDEIGHDLIARMADALLTRERAARRLALEEAAVLAQKCCSCGPREFCLACQAVTAIRNRATEARDE